MNGTTWPGPCSWAGRAAEVGAMVGGEVAVLAVWTTRQLWFDGIVNGMVFGLLALGVVLVYRSTRVINLAVGNMGLPATGLMTLLTFNYGFPYWAEIGRASCRERV